MCKVLLAGLFAECCSPEIIVTFIGGQESILFQWVKPIFSCSPKFECGGEQESLSNQQLMPANRRYVLRRVSV